MNDKLNPISAGFNAPELEHSYRQTHLRADRAQALLAISLTAVPIGTFAFSDYQIFGVSPQFYKLMTVRAVVVIISLICATIFWKSEREGIFDMAILIWLFSLCNFELYIAATRPPDYVFHLAIDTAMLIAVYALVPTRFLFQLASAIYFTLFSVYVNLHFRHQTPVSQRAVFIIFFVINLCGIWISWRLHIDRRTQFDLLLTEKHLADELKTALQSIKTLSGLLPICASCKNIRDDDGYWHQVESYIRAHTNVDFSHSICPDCMKKLYPRFAKDKPEKE